MAKTMTVPMQDAEGNTVARWRVWQEQGMYFSGWMYRSEDGCERAVEGNWNDLVIRFHATADNYGFTTRLS